VIAVSTAVPKPTMINARCGPMRSASQPPGIINRAYPSRNAEKIAPICVSESENSRAMDGPAMDMAVR
jgi:hypothetical protein